MFVFTRLRVPATEELRDGPPLDAYDLVLLSFLCVNLKAPPRAVLSKALQALFQKETGQRPSRRKVMGGKARRELGSGKR